MKKGLTLFSLVLCVLAAGTLFAATGNEKTLYQDSIQATKQSIAQETLGIFYNDALDNYHEGRYEEALMLLDKIHAINPQYQDVDKLRATIRKKQESHVSEQNLDTIRDWMKKGDAALRDGNKIEAVSAWKRALAIKKDYAPAKKKIEEVNKGLGKKEFEAGYIHYNRGEMEEALESWSNALALDPSYKDRGLLMLMSKTQLQVTKDQVSRLTAQGFDQYQQGHLEDALRTYEELSARAPRNQEARRMASKIKIQLGETALSAAQRALDKRDYAEAILQADRATNYGFETVRAKTIKSEAEQASKSAGQKKAEKKVTAPEPKSEETTPPPPATATVEPAAQEEALLHYRRGLAAIRNKDYQLAIRELDIATQLDPTNERIYISRERAKQEWNAANSGAGGAQ